MSEAYARWSRRSTFAIRIERSTEPVGNNPFNRLEARADVATVFQARESRELGSLRCCEREPCRESTIVDAAVSADEKYLVVGGPVLCVYSLPSLAPLSKYGAAGGATNEAAADFAFTSRGTLVQGAGSTLKILDLSPSGVLSEDSARQEPRMHLLEGVRIAVHPEGWEVASAGGRTAGSRGTGGDPPPQAETISLFNVDSGDRSGALRGNSSPVVSLTYSPSGKGFASLARDGGLLYFPTRKGQGVTASTEATAFAFLGDATLVVGTRSGSAFMFDANQPPPGQRLVGLDQPVLNIATEGGRAIAIQTASGRTFVCRREGACTEARFHGATRGGLSFAPGGLALGSVPADGVPVWIETGG